MCYYLLSGENSTYNPRHSKAIFLFRSSHVNLNWLILLQANLRPYGSQVFLVMLMREWLKVSL